MTVPFMRAYTELLVKTCHRRGAHAMGGMAPFIPSRKNPEINEKALAKVRADKQREVADGFDGTWVAHPDLVPTAKEVFDRKLGAKPQPEGPPALRGAGDGARSCMTRACRVARSPRPGFATTSTWRCSTSTPGSRRTAPPPSTT